jgi:hypothetical protein
MAAHPQSFPELRRGICEQQTVFQGELSAPPLADPIANPRRLRIGLCKVLMSSIVCFHLHDELSS